MPRRNRSTSIGAAAVWAAVLALGFAQLLAQAPEAAKGIKYVQINQTDLKEWLTYLSSDELQGRQIYTEGYGLAASYIAEHLKQWNVKPLGDDGTFFQQVKVKGYKVTRNSFVTVTVNGQARTFKHGDHVTFAANSGGKQQLTFDGVEFVGYGNASDYKDRNVKNKLVVWMANRAPAPANAAGGGNGRGGGGGGGRGGGGTASALNTLGAKAAISFAPGPTPPSAAEEAVAKAQAALDQATQAMAQAQQQLQGRGGPGGRGPAPATGRGAAAGRGTVTPDVTTVQRVDNIIPPQFTADDTFFEFLFSAAPVKFADLRTRAEKGEPLDPISLPNTSAAVTIDNTFDVVSMQLTKNVVGMIEGTDPKLKDTYVMFGAHLDHVGYRPNGGGRGGGMGSCRRTQESVAAQAQAGRGAAGGGAGGGRGVGAGNQGAAQGRGGAPPVAAPPIPLEQQDIISNGADDDGSGSTAMLGIAKAFATGPKPKRSLVLVWHAGEESGLLGSRYNADFPVVPLDKVQAQLNMDMIGRDDCDNANGDYSNTVFVVGADRISTDLHNLIVDTNAIKANPLKLDYELNDPADPESVYTRSDHYSYASKGIPIAFFTTGLHKDYHQVSDSVEKIIFPKLARIAQLVYETGFSVANTDRVLERDNKGARTGKTSSGKLSK